MSSFLFAFRSPAKSLWRQRSMSCQRNHQLLKNCRQILAFLLYLLECVDRRLYENQNEIAQVNDKSNPDRQWFEILKILFLFVSLKTVNISMYFLMDFPVLNLAILSTVPWNPAFGALLQIFSWDKTVPAQFAPFLDQVLDFDSIFFFDEFSHSNVVQC